MHAETVYDPEIGQAVGPYTIAGSTGRFEDATGTGIQISRVGAFGTISF